METIICDGTKNYWVMKVDTGMGFFLCCNDLMNQGECKKPRFRVQANVLEVIPNDYIAENIRKRKINTGSYHTIAYHYLMLNSKHGK